MKLSVEQIVIVMADRRLGHLAEHFSLASHGMDIEFVQRVYDIMCKRGTNVRRVRTEKT